MHTVKVRDIATITLVPFMEIRPTDVLILGDLITKLHRNKGRDKYFLWAQSSCSLTDIQLQEKKREPLEHDNTGNPIVKLDYLEPPKIQVYLSAQEDRDCFCSWPGKYIEIPRDKNELNKEEVALYESNCLGHKIGVDQIAGLNDGHHFFDKECWVLRGKSDSDVHPMALAHCISDLIDEATVTFDGIDDITNHVSGLKLDKEKLREFCKTQAKNYPKNIRYQYQGYDYTAEWTKALGIIAAQTINIAKIAEPFRNMGMLKRSTAESIMDLNNKLGSLFLTPAEYEIFVRSGSLGYGVPLRLNDPDSKQWLKWHAAHRGQAAIKAYLEVLGYFRRVKDHCSSSPIERIFACKLLEVCPPTEIILLKAELVLMDAFFEEHGKNIAKGEKWVWTEANKKRSEQSKKQKKDAIDEIEAIHKRSPCISFTACLKKAGENLGIALRTMQRHVKKADCPSFK
jgi:hypothetical protein